MRLINLYPFVCFLLCGLLFGCKKSEITAPSSNDTVSRTMQCEGYISKTEKGNHFWLMVEELDSLQQPIYWPKEPEILPDRSGHFSVEIFEDGPGKSLTLSLFAVDDQGQKTIIDWLKRGTETGEYPPLKTIPGGQKLDQIQDLRVVE